MKAKAGRATPQIVADGTGEHDSGAQTRTRLSARPTETQNVPLTAPLGSGYPKARRDTPASTTSRTCSASAGVRGRPVTSRRVKRGPVRQSTTTS